MIISSNICKFRVLKIVTVATDIQAATDFLSDSIMKRRYSPFLYLEEGLGHRYDDDKSEYEVRII